MVSPITSPTSTVTTQASEEEVPPITSPAPAYPMYLWMVKYCNYPGIYDNYRVAQNHANRHSDVHRFESREAAEEFMGSTAFQTYNTSDNSYLSVFGERIYKVYTDGSHTYTNGPRARKATVGTEFGSERTILTTWLPLFEEETSVPSRQNYRPL